jgi:peptidoglycan/xylan/chitin deacetylase (PgdA/CDA1 family)
LSGQHTFISHSEAVDKILSGTIDKSYISISSDDGLKNNMRAAAVMNDFGVKGCFFICPGMIGEKNPDKITDFCKNRLHFPPVEFMDWGDVHKLQAQGHEIGGHTMSHINIAATRADELTKEIADCYDIIKARCGGSVHFAYPYGLFSHFTEKARQLVIEKGFASCASAQRGCHIVEQDGKILPADLLIRRDHIILDWPLQHSLFFVERNAVKASVENNFYPALCA